MKDSAGALRSIGAVTPSAIASKFFAVWIISTETFSSLFASFFARYRKPKRAALSRFAFNSDITAVAAHDFFGNIESQPGSFGFGVRYLEKFFKDPLLKFLQNSFAGVCNRKTHCSIGDGGAECDGPGRRRMTQRIADEICKHVTDAFVIR